MSVLCQFSFQTMCVYLIDCIVTELHFTDIHQLIPADIKWDPNATPPQYTDNGDQVIEKGTHLRIKLIGTRSDVGSMFAIGSVKEDFLGSDAQSTQLAPAADPRLGHSEVVGRQPLLGLGWSASVDPAKYVDMVSRTEAGAGASRVAFFHVLHSHIGIATMALVTRSS